MATPGYPEVRVVLYYYVIAGGKKFPGQVEIAGTAGTDGTFSKAFVDTMSEFLAEPDENTLVTFEPREIGGGGFKAASTPSSQPQAAVAATGQLCAIHNVAFTVKSGKYGSFESCPEKNTDGSWCKWKPQG